MRRLLHLCEPDDADRLLPLVAAFHAEKGIATTEAGRQAAILPLLQGTPHGAAYLIGPRRAPVGYIVMSFGWSVAFGGMDGFLDEIYLRPAVRGKGMASEALSALMNGLKYSDLRALHLEVEQGDPSFALYERLGFRDRPRHGLMSWAVPK